MSDENTSENSPSTTDSPKTKPSDSSDPDFLERLANEENPSLHLMPPTAPEQELRAARLRKEFAESMLQSRQFQETIQMLNEEVMVELVAASPLETEKLVALCVRAQVISDFTHKLDSFADEYETIRLIQEQNERNMEDYG
jgi:hypothetical protein